MKTDQHATNGIVHVVDRVITAITNDIHSFIDTDDNLETLRVGFILLYAYIRFWQREAFLWHIDMMGLHDR